MEDKYDIMVNSYLSGGVTGFSNAQWNGTDFSLSANTISLIGNVKSNQYYVKTINSDYELLASDSIILVDATDNNITVTLPNVAEGLLKQLAIKRIDASGNTVTVDASGGSYIDGEASVSLTTQYQRLVVVSDGSYYFRID